MSSLTHISPLASPRFRWAMWSMIVALLLAPLLAMQFTDEVKWDEADFLFAGALLIGAGALFELAARTIRSTGWLAIAGISLAAAVFLIWLEAAVGIF